jgi:hypothetical protein
MVIMPQRKSRGYLYSIEVLLAVSAIFLALFFLFRAPAPEPDIEMAIVKQQGFYALEYLSSHDILEKYVADNNELAIERTLSDILSQNINFETEICRQNCDQTNVPANTTVIAVDYYVSAYKNIYLGKKLRLWLWV